MRWAFLAIAIALLARAIALRWDDVSQSLSSVRPLTFIGACLAAAAALWFNTLSWRAVMTAVGLDAPLGQAAGVFLLSQSGKYVPGAVWPVLAQSEFAREHGVSRSKSLTGSVVAMVVGVATAGLVACGFLVAASPASFASYWWTFPVALALAATVFPPVLRRLVAVAFRMTRRRDEAADIGGRAVAVSAAWSIANWLALGLQAWLLLREVVPPASAMWALATGAFALAWLVGFLAVIAPAGVGAREVALVAALASVATAPQALAMAVLSRLAMTLADAVGVVVAVGLRRWGARAQSRVGEAESR